MKIVRIIITESPLMRNVILRDKRHRYNSNILPLSYLEFYKSSVTKNPTKKTMHQFISKILTHYNIFTLNKHANSSTGPFGENQAIKKIAATKLIKTPLCHC
jgi:hypothetical protein